MEGWDSRAPFAPGARPTLSPKIFIHPPSALDSALQPLALAHHKGYPLSSPGRPYSIYFVPLVWVGGIIGSVRQLLTGRTKWNRSSTPSVKSTSSLSSALLTSSPLWTKEPPCFNIVMIDAPDYIPTGSTVQGEEECTGEFYAIGNIVLREGAV